eukprot:GFYU01004567.1.p1 GENE.GFYU01004567.1~~GFYU01004567.1.p1  ORF type:complete len:224 (+),score=70.81 GFYU01004567.1:89-760(+)
MSSPPEGTRSRGLSDFERFYFASPEERAKTEVTVDDLSVGGKKIRKTILVIAVIQFGAGIWAIVNALAFRTQIAEVSAILGGIGTLDKATRAFIGAYKLNTKQLTFFTLVTHFTLLLSAIGTISGFALNDFACELKEAAFDGGSRGDWCDHSASNIANYYIQVIALILTSVLGMHFCMNLKKKIKTSQMIKFTRQHLGDRDMEKGRKGEMYAVSQDDSDDDHH